MKKKALSALSLLLVLALLLSGCGVFDVPYQLGRWIGEKMSGAFSFWESTESTEESSAARPWERPSKETEEPSSSGSDDKEPSSDEPQESEETQYAFDQDFLDFTNEIYAYYIGEDTLNIHFSLVHPENYGMSTSPARWSRMKWGEEATEEYRLYLDEIEDGLYAFDYESLTEEEQMIYDSLLYFIETERMSLGLELYTEPLGPNTGIQAELPVTLSEYTFYEESDVKDYLELCEGLSAFFEDLLAFEQAKKEAGLFMQDALLDEVIAQCDSFLESREDSFLIDSFERRLDTLSLGDEIKQDYLAKNQAAVDAVYEAYILLRDGLSELSGDDSELSGLSRLPEGDAYYEYLIRSSVGSARRPEEMITLLENTIEGAIGTMNDCYRKNYFIDSEVEMMEYPSTDPALIMRMLIEKSREDFPELSDVDYRINYVDPSLREYLSPAFYFVAPFDDESVNNIYINAEKGSEDEDIFVVLAHEGYPGHLYQTNYLKDHSVYPIRQFLEPVGYSEGWAKYVEFMSYDYIDGISDTAADFLRANALATICIHARVDLGIHFEGWDVDDIENYVSQYFGEAREVAEWMMSYISGDPGGYLDYAVGVAEIYSLLSEAGKQSDFKLVEFHRDLLDLAGAPFPVIRERLFPGTETGI